MYRRVVAILLRYDGSLILLVELPTVTYSATTSRVLSSQLQKSLELNISRATSVYLRLKLKLKMPRLLTSPMSGSILVFRSRDRTVKKITDKTQTVCKHCKTRLPYTMSNTSNMMCHLKWHHNNKLLQAPVTKSVKEGQTSIQRSFAATCLSQVRKLRAWRNMVPGLQYPNQFAKSNIVDHRKWSHVFCNKNFDASGYFLSFRTWLRPCCSKTALYRCLVFFHPFFCDQHFF